MKTLITIILFFITSISYSQSFKVVVNYVKNDGTVNNSNIYYGTKKVSWLDFKGKPDYTVDFEALTYSELGMNYELTQVDSDYVLTINVYCDFSKKKSYVKPPKKHTGWKNYKFPQPAMVLIHEQHHFDLTYIYTKRFIESLKLGNYTADNYESVLNSIYNNSVDNLNQEQTKYDAETKHSTIVEKQLEWNKKIDDELAALNNNGNLASK